MFRVPTARCRDRKGHLELLELLERLDRRDHKAILGQQAQPDRKVQREQLDRKVRRAIQERRVRPGQRGRLVLSPRLRRFPITAARRPSRLTLMPISRSTAI